MTKEQWNSLKSIIKGDSDDLRVGLIVDSPWMPGYCGISTINFYARPDEWFNAYMKIKKDFPDVFFLPDWWAEYGMVTEPSGFGVKIDFFDDNLPNAHPLITDMDDAGDIINSLTLPDPRKNGMMPLLLNLQKYFKPKLAEIGEEINIVSTRGPLTIASHLFSVSEMLLCTKVEPELIHKLLKLTTQLCKDWLSAQLESVQTADGILMLDDITGFFGKEDYEEFAHPYLKEVFSAFPECLHLFHNDTDSDICFGYMEDMGVDLFNFTYLKDIGETHAKTGKNVSLLGNVPPMALAKNTPDEVYSMAKACIDSYKAVNGSTRGLLLSIGGGVPMGARGECINALLNAAKDT